MDCVPRIDLRDVMWHGPLRVTFCIYEVGERCKMANDCVIECFRFAAEARFETRHFHTKEGGVVGG